MAQLDDLLDAVKTAVDGLGYTFQGSPLTSRIVKQPTHRNLKDEPTAFVTVRKAQQPETVSRWSFGLNLNVPGRKRIDYFITVTLQGPRGRLYEAVREDLGQYSSWRDDVVALFTHYPLGGAADVFDLWADPADYVPAGGNLDKYDFESVLVRLSVVRNN